MSNSIYPIIPCLWFDRQAEEAVSFYVELFGNSEIGHKAYFEKAGQDQHGMPEGTLMSCSFKLHGQEFLALNGNHQYPFSPGISFYVTCETLAEAEKYWEALQQGGQVMMPFDKYDWSEKYGFLNDKFGVAWQISLGKISDVKQKFVPSLLFVGDKFGKAESAIEFYMGIFKEATLEGIARFTEEEGEGPDKVKHAQFYLNGSTFTIMESSISQTFGFTPAISFIVHCDTQEEIDHYWEKLTEGGGDEVQCGWLYDHFGISWQGGAQNAFGWNGGPQKSQKTDSGLYAYEEIKHH
ncbi:VOC family protein [Pararhodonellum marinum]|uniref:VOC family protein n=1 Tax=Pararhodonellum marinum TaxID=2755358 RepID=UPI001E29D26E|nr:VOC family protein [Pararhodonellum marinum]